VITLYDRYEKPIAEAAYDSVGRNPIFFRSRLTMVFWAIQFVLRLFGKGKSSVLWSSTYTSGNPPLHSSAFGDRTSVPRNHSNLEWVGKQTFPADVIGHSYMCARGSLFQNSLSYVHVCEPDTARLSSIMSRIDPRPP
jgi:hypothetical protein